MEFSNRQLQTLTVINTNMSEAWDYWCTTFFVLFFLFSLSAFFKNNLTWRWQLHIHNIVSQFYPLTRSFTFRQHHSVDDIMYSKSICKKVCCPVWQDTPHWAQSYTISAQRTNMFFCVCECECKVQYFIITMCQIQQHSVKCNRNFCKGLMSPTGE